MDGQRICRFHANYWKYSVRLHDLLDIRMELVGLSARCESLDNPRFDLELQFIDVGDGNWRRRKTVAAGGGTLSAGALG